MIRLSFSREPQRIDLGRGVILMVAPVTSLEREAARFHALKRLTDATVAAETFEALGAPGLSLDEPADRAGMLDILFNAETAKRCVVSVEGIEDDEGPLDSTRMTVVHWAKLFLDDNFRQNFIFGALGSSVLFSQEGEGSARSVNGSVAGARAIARFAETKAESALVA